MDWRVRWEQGSEPLKIAPEYRSVIANDSENLYCLTTRKDAVCSRGRRGAHLTEFLHGLDRILTLTCELASRRLADSLCVYRPATGMSPAAPRLSRNETGIPRDPERYAAFRPNNGCIAKPGNAGPCPPAAGKRCAFPGQAIDRKSVV